MRHANFRVVQSTRDRMVLADLGPWDQHPTITNDAEWVVDQVACGLGDRDLLYLDSYGELTRLLVYGGRFAGFAPVVQP